MAPTPETVNPSTMSNANTKWAGVAHLYLKSSVLVGEYIPHKTYSDGTAEGFETVFNWYTDTTFNRADRVYLPILRPLASMTEEEAREWFRIEEGRDWPEGGYMEHDTALERWNFWLEVMLVPQFLFTPAAFLYILKKGFDLFNLIEAGKAIDAKTLEANP